MSKFSQKIAQIFTGASAAATLFAGRVLASGNPAQEGAALAQGEGMPADLEIVFRQITNTVLIVIGAVSVVMLIWGGLRYILSGGDNKKVTDAKNTILYAIIGLIICLLAYAIVNFVISAIGSTAA